MIKENFLNILMYVFENYIEDEIKLKKPESIISQMVNAGFGRDQANEAIEWFNHLAWQQNTKTAFVNDFKPGAFRIFSEYEQHKFTEEARDFLLQLENTGIIDSQIREIILHQALTVNEPIIDIEEIQWVTLMSLYGLPDKKHQLSLLEDLILFHKSGTAH